MFFSGTIIYVFLHIIFVKNKLSFSDAVFMISFSCMENIARKFGLQINQEKTKYIIDERKNSLRKNKIGHLKIKNYKFDRLENFRYLGVILNEDNNNQLDLQERIKNANKTYFMLQQFFLNKNTETKIKTKEHNNRQNVNTCISKLGH